MVGNGTNVETNDYLYGGKELQQRFGVNLYDSQARFQSNTGAFTSPDPLAEKYYSISPYAYCAGNPVNAVDFYGRDTVMVLDRPFRPLDNGTKGSSYTAEIFYIRNGVASIQYRGSSYPNSISNSNNSAAFKTVNEGEYPYNNMYGHKGGKEKGLNIVDSKGKRIVSATDENGNKTTATYVNVHSGYSDNGNYNSRGSHACITVHPNDAEAFFENFSWTNTTKTTGDSEGTIIISRNEKENIRLKKEVGIISKSFYDKFIDFINNLYHSARTK